jgi:hypothetical protein
MHQAQVEKLKRVIFEDRPNYFSPTAYFSPTQAQPQLQTSEELCQVVTLCNYKHNLLWCFCYGERKSNFRKVSYF